MTEDIEAVAKDIVDAAYKVHKEFGPGLLESAYQACHAYELRKRGRIVQTELKLPIFYDGQEFDEGYRIDEFVDNLVIVENKAVDEIHPVHMAQLITYLKLKNCKLGFLINWNVKLIKNGITRVANGIENPSIPVKYVRRT
ncbi:GxxExxY protein [Chloroflexi bacterium CFX6]|nr:GxxExxY protein [Ignavibacteriota bacterium]MBL1173483.1 GxxExxY protein [Chloroflexota bacterium]MDL1912864.1 GxxExxY protein [Chloroflexi bacterium CFX6]WKZ53578.1 MAG: GxxExxY protein [Anaerolineales bacterium]NOG76997.1 GxxExxY protein [Chloroflexota bacterium]